MRTKSACSIPECSAPSRSRGWCEAHYARWRHHGDPRAEIPVLIRRSLAERLVLYTDKSGGPDACWPWLGARNDKGYGDIRIGGKTRRVARLVYELDRGHAPEKPLVCHHCDNPPCVNPKHLYAGTAKDNNLDSVRRGRARSPQGADNGNAKLTDAQVREIRARYLLASITQRQLAQQYGVSQNVIGRVLRREGWPHVL